MSSRSRGDAGAAILEFAIVAPLLFLFFTVLADIGLLVLGTSVASGAARDGARVGLIHFRDADIPTSASFLLVENAVKSRVVGLIKPGSGTYVSVHCLDGLTKATKACNSGVVIDHDVIEVTLSWQPIMPGGDMFVTTSRTTTARMVIAGDGSGTTVSPPNSATVGFSAASVSTGTTEADNDTTVSLTISRSSSSGTAAVSFATSSGTATSGTDYGQLANVVNFAALESTRTIDITIRGDDASESQETFTVVLSNPVGATLEPGRSSATVTITDDDSGDGTAPSLTSIQMRDTTLNGKVDQLTMTFNEVLATTCPTPSAFGFTSAPSGGAVQSVSISGQ
ncbi:MAG: fibronectin-binding autotransporter adhesin, partial [Nocardioidaceae bacterium]|nr:fibronectin-binding autotransporter adhesin [Nocardioidaceae bacterium]